MSVPPQLVQVITLLVKIMNEKDIRESASKNGAQVDEADEGTESMKRWESDLGKGCNWIILDAEGKEVGCYVAKYRKGVVFSSGILETIRSAMITGDYFFLIYKNSPFALFSPSNRILWATSDAPPEQLCNDGGGGIGEWVMPDADLRKYAPKGYESRACNLYFAQSTLEEILVNMYVHGWLHGWSLHKPGSMERKIACELIGSTPTSLAVDLEERGWYLMRKHGSVTLTRRPGDYMDEHKKELSAKFVERLKKLDWRACRLPDLSESDLTDPESGLWELFNVDLQDVDLKALNLVARDPQLDIRRGRVVAIDFGTSSTVVAVSDGHGGSELLRVGVRDFLAPPKAGDYENPTVLQMIDWQHFADVWNKEAYSPEVDWEWIHAAHEAQASFRDAGGDAKVLAGILPRLKSWALHFDDMERHLPLLDSSGREVDISRYEEWMPVRDKPLEAGGAFDPVELYAWFLGKVINWRRRGLFLKYYITFPVKYPAQVRSRIKASFARGLQRSLPRMLIEGERGQDVLKEFEVTALASEPVAYAAAALRHLHVEPEEEKPVPYAVFDFGGGTTDFAFGLLRWATDEEEDKEGCERVFEHLDSGGDNDLGGENLLDKLVYQTFLDNLDELRKNRIQFVRPLHCDSFAGSELLLADTQAARANMVMLAAKLRPFMEQAEQMEGSADEDAPKQAKFVLRKQDGSTEEFPSQVTLDLLDQDGAKQSCTLRIDSDALDKCLATPILNGILKFLAKMKEISDRWLKDVPVHVLLAGNSCRSRYITNIFFENDGAVWGQLVENAFDKTAPKFIVHPPLPLDDKNPMLPTMKTGVALGLLRLVPGEGAKLIDCERNRNAGDTPFLWSVGRMRRGEFVSVLRPSEARYGDWHELGVLQQGVFNVCYCKGDEPAALSEGDRRLLKEQQEFPGTSVGDRLFVRAKNPNEIELVTVPAGEEPKEDVVPRKMRLKLQGEK